MIVNGVTSGFNRPGTPTYGQPAYVVAPDSKNAYMDVTGVIRNAAPASAAARNTKWNDAGTALLPFNAGLYSQASALGPRVGGDGPSVYSEAGLRTPIERFALFGAGSYELTEAVTPLDLLAKLTDGRATASNPRLAIDGRRFSRVLRTILKAHVDLELIIQAVDNFAVNT